MTDFLRRVSRLALGLTPTAQPLVVSRYAPGTLMPALETPLVEDRPLESRAEPPPQPEAESPAPARPAVATGAITGRPSAQMAAHSAPRENAAFFSPEASAPTATEAAESSAPPSGNVSQAAASSLRQVRYPADWQAGEVSETAAPLDAAAAAETRAPLDMQDSAPDPAAQTRLLPSAQDHAASEKNYVAGPTRAAPPRAAPSSPELRRSGSELPQSGAESQQLPARAIYEESQSPTGIEQRDNKTTYVKTDAPAAPPRRADTVSSPANGYEEAGILAADNSALGAQASERSLQVSPRLVPEPDKPGHAAEAGFAQSLSSERDRTTHETGAPALPGKSDTGARPPSPVRPTAAQLLSAQDDGAERRASGQVIRVHIGRIEVRAVMPPAPAVETAAPPAPQLSLDEYLRQRNGRAR